MKKSEIRVSSFRELKEAFEQRAAGSSGPPSGSRSDGEIFDEAMSGVREIAEFRALKTESVPPKPAPAREDRAMEGLRDLVSGRGRVVLSDTDEYIEWVGPGARRDIAARLHGGEFSVQDFIDLHGMGLEEAEYECAKFIASSVRRRLFCVKVIHGRGLKSPGEPVLKCSLEKWLKGPLSKYVLAYATARQCDGGLGATCVILR